VDDGVAFTLESLSASANHADVCLCSAVSSMIGCRGFLRLLEHVRHGRKECHLVIGLAGDGDQAGTRCSGHVVCRTNSPTSASVSPSTDTATNFPGLVTPLGQVPER
jgi:hypothetical protein